jgi:YD repeat-containing protein
MTGALKDRPVGMSRAQFDLALEKREAFWLYVVEYASETEAARVVKIQDPAGRARTFTYDSGWLSIAETDPEDSISNQRKF